MSLLEARLIESRHLKVGDRVIELDFGMHPGSIYDYHSGRYRRYRYYECVNTERVWTVEDIDMWHPTVSFGDFKSDDFNYDCVRLSFANEDCTMGWESIVQRDSLWLLL